MSSICNQRSDCVFDDDEKLCSPRFSPYRGWIPRDEYTGRDKILRELVDADKPKIVYFSLRNFPNYSASVLLTESKSNEQGQNQSLTIISSFSEQSSKLWPSKWTCNRGITVRVENDFKCLCPPSYYGDFCENQNQRVSLSVRVRIDTEWNHIFTFVITFIDHTDEQIINSYDQFTYIAIRDCQTKFNMYFLYANQPKDPNKKLFNTSGCLR